MKPKVPLGFLGSAFLASALSAQDIPVSNWTVPPYTQSPSGITAMTDATPPRVFIGVQPCRLVDTRAAAGFPAGYGPPSLAAGVPRNFDLDNGPCPGLPSGIDAYSLNVTVVNTAGPGHLVIYPQGGAQPTVSSINYVAGETIANAVIVPAGSGGGVTVIAGVSGTNLLIDINGYFSDMLGGTGNFLELRNNVAGAPTALFNNASAATNSSAVFGLAGAGIPRPAYAAAGVRGEGALTGVLGISHSLGVAGSFVNGAGVEVAFGILGHQVNNPEPEITGDNVGVFGQTNDNAGGHAGVLGYAPAGTGRIYGVRGVTGSASFGAAGVRGQDGNGPVNSGLSFSAGVWGESKFGLGVVGATSANGFCAVFGAMDFGGPNSSTGGLGCGDNLGVVGTSVAAIGSVSFIEPHPSSPALMIRYTSLQGSEPGTFFRGRGKFQNGIAVIDVPEDFRIVTDAEGLSIQVTPIGEMATVAVQSIGLDRIVVRGSRNVEFFYTVNGVRRAYKESRPIAKNEKMFVPHDPDDTIPAYLPAELRQRLISNGTYTADGKVNMDTARRLGWDKIWEKRSRPAPQPVEP